MFVAAGLLVVMNEQLIMCIFSPHASGLVAWLPASLILPCEEILLCNPMCTNKKDLAQVDKPFEITPRWIPTH